MSIRLGIVNDYEVVVRGVAEMVRTTDSELEVVELACRMPIEHSVDIALFDTFAMGPNTAPGVSELATNPHVGRVVIYSWTADPGLVEECLNRGAHSFLSKTLPSDKLVRALHSVHAGERVVAAGPDPAEPTGGVWPGKEHGLTPRESEVIAMITQGLSNNEIAERASLSINSVKSYIRTSYRKMGVTSRTNAVLWALQHGFSRHPARTQVRLQA
jgi:DNA-binding NarL/FixJ family response regulator